MSNSLLASDLLDWSYAHKFWAICKWTQYRGIMENELESPKGFWVTIERYTTPYAQPSRCKDVDSCISYFLWFSTAFNTFSLETDYSQICSVVAERNCLYLFGWRFDMFVSLCPGSFQLVHILILPFFMCL